MAGWTAAAATPPMTVQVYSSVESLPPSLIAFVDAAAEESFFHSIAWFRTVLGTSGLPTNSPRIYAAESNGRPVALLFARERRVAGRMKTHMLLGPSRGMFVQLFEPLLDGELGPAGLGEIARAIAHASPPFDVLRFDGLGASSPAVAALTAALRKAGLLLQRFSYPSYFYDEVEGLSVEQCVDRLPPETRALINPPWRR